MVTFNNVQFTNEPITSQDLFIYNKRLRGISDGLKEDGIVNTSFNSVLDRCYARTNKS
jgi:hypothetical protein